MDKNVLDTCIKTEHIYKTQFSKALVKEGYTIYVDDKLPEMYSHNMISIHQNQSRSKIVEIIQSELQKQSKQKDQFLQIEFQGELVELADDIKPKFVTTLEYYCLDVESYQKPLFQETTIIRRATSESDYFDGRKIDILANQEGMGLEFSTKRIERKIDCYKNKDNQIQFYVAYNTSGEVIGDCEFLPNHQVAKIEDFDIYSPYQKQGHGSNMLRHFVLYAKEHDIKYLYLITDRDDTAKVMYEKFGFKQIGTKTEILYMW